MAVYKFNGIPENLIKTQSSVAFLIHWIKCKTGCHMHSVSALKLVKYAVQCVNSARVQSTKIRETQLKDIILLCVYMNLDI